MDKLSWGMLLLLSLFWGSSFFFVVTAQSELTPWDIVALRCLFGMLSLSPFVLFLGLRGRIANLKPYLVHFFILGSLNLAIPFLLITHGQLYVESGLAAVFNASTVFWGALIAHFMVRGEPMRRSKLLGITLGIAGIATLIGFDTGGVNVPLGGGLIMLANFCYGFGASLGKRKEHFSPLIASFLISASATFVVWTLWFLRGGQLVETFSNLALETWLSVLMLGVFGTGLAFLLYFRLLKRAGAVNVLLTTFLVPVWAQFLGLFFLGEVLSSWELAGMVLIGLGLAVLDGRPWRYVSRTARRRRVPLEP